MSEAFKRIGNCRNHEGSSGCCGMLRHSRDSISTNRKPKALQRSPATYTFPPGTSRSKFWKHTAALSCASADATFSKVTSDLLSTVFLRLTHKPTSLPGFSSAASASSASSAPNLTVIACQTPPNLFLLPAPAELNLTGPVFRFSWPSANSSK